MTPLAPRTTFRIGGPAKALWEAGDEASLVSLVREHPRAVLLGGGSNVLVPDEGLDEVIAIASRGVRFDDLGDRERATVEAGEPWDAFVAACVARGLAGVECLSGIPGQTGATPIQNVGAYGQEVADVIEGVRVFDRRADGTDTLPASACGFRYRDSVFKSGEPGRWVVLGVTFVLRKGPPAAPRYDELSKALGDAPLDARRVRDVVVGLRRKKGMVLDDADLDTHGAGSFFTNPIVPAAVADEVARRASERGLPAPPRFPGEGEGTVKLAAGWLIEKAGVEKGFTMGRAAVSTKHALALTNRGGATTAEVLALAAEVVTRVERAWGVTLGREPVLLG